MAGGGKSRATVEGKLRNQDFANGEVLVGLVGAGGIGAEIVARLRFRGDWPKAGAALILTIVAVLLIDAASAAIRRRIITGQPSKSPVSKWMMAITGSSRDPRLTVDPS